MRLFKCKFFSKGFTLIELLIVIAIIGVLAAGVTIAINPTQRINAAKNARVKSDLVQIAESAKMFSLQVDAKSCRLGGSYSFRLSESGLDMDGGYTCGIKWNYPNPPKPPNGFYHYKALSQNGNDCLPDVSRGYPACTKFSIAGPAYQDSSSNPPVNNATSFWCSKSSSGRIELVANYDDCTP